MDGQWYIGRVGVCVFAIGPVSSGERRSGRAVSYVLCGGGRRGGGLVRRDFFISQALRDFLADGFDREKSGDDCRHGEGYGGE